jgi:glycosyltransferase involved in cell wall biosynthesis
VANFREACGGYAAHVPQAHYDHTLLATDVVQLSLTRQALLIELKITVAEPLVNLAGVESDSTMKILWICPFFLHPTNRGAQIRTLGTLKELHKRHEIHFAALNDPLNTEGPQRSSEYSSRHFAVEHVAPARRSLGIIPQVAASILRTEPMAVFRYASEKLKRTIDALIATENYDSIVCDFLFSTPNVSDLGKCVLFQHDVVTTIWKRHVEQNRTSIKRHFFQMQATKVEAYERKVCRSAKHVIAVSEIDAEKFRRMAEIDTVTSVPTGVDVEYFAPRGDAAPASDMVFCGSMDSLPNVDAVVYFLTEVLPLIRNQLPGATFTIAGRSPDPRVLKAAHGLEGVTVTGKVDDIRPYLWGSKISIVPIRIGSGTRLKIYECMAAGIPVVSTTVGAEGLPYENGTDIVIADGAAEFATACVRMISADAARRNLAGTALLRMQTTQSWAAVTRDFEAILESNRLPHA